jgi:hypothetical protein
LHDGHYSLSFLTCVRCHQWHLRIRACNASVPCCGETLNRASWRLGNKSIQPKLSNWKLTLLYKWVLPECAHLSRDWRPSECDLLSRKYVFHSLFLLASPKALSQYQRWGGVWKGFVVTTRAQALTILQRDRLQQRPPKETRLRRQQLDAVECHDARRVRRLLLLSRRADRRHRRQLPVQLHSCRSIISRHHGRQSTHPPFPHSSTSKFGVVQWLTLSPFSSSLLRPNLRRRLRQARVVVESRVCCRPL